jgi:thiol-disulfide isomerase/thioredoxin
MNRRTFSVSFALGLAIAAGVPPVIVGVKAEAAGASLAPVLAAPDWLNGRLTHADVAGKVVIVDVFTFDCINCKHVIPNLQRLHAQLPAADFAIVGVHAPETPEERQRTNVVRELARQGIVWPVALDNSFVVWKALDNEYWPTQYIFDRRGTLRRTVVGEGQDDEVTSTVRALIAEKPS